MALNDASSLQADLPTSTQDGAGPISIKIFGVFGDGGPATTPDGTVVNVSMFPTIPGSFKLFDVGGSPIAPSVVLRNNLWEGLIDLTVDPAKALRAGYSTGQLVGLSVHLWSPTLGLGGNSTRCDVWGWAGSVPKLGHRLVVLLDPPTYATLAGAVLDTRLTPDQAHDVLVLDGDAPLLERIVTGSVAQ